MKFGENLPRSFFEILKSQKNFENVITSTNMRHYVI